MSLVHETVSGKPLDRAMEIARRLSSHTPESLAYIKRLVRNATETPQRPALERKLFLKLCISEPALARMRSYEEKKMTSPSRSIEVKMKFQWAGIEWAMKFANHKPEFRPQVESLVDAYFAFIGSLTEELERRRKTEKLEN